MNKAFLIGLFALAMVGMMSPFASAQKGKKSDSVVKVKATLEKAPPGKAIVLLTLNIEAGWHLYANPVGVDDLDTSQVVVTVKDAAAKVVYPVGKEVTEESLGKYKIYEDKIEIRATIDRPAEATGPIEVTVRLQACDAKTCLPPATVKVTVPK